MSFLLKIVLSTELTLKNKMKPNLKALLKMGPIYKFLFQSLLASSNEKQSFLYWKNINVKKLPCVKIQPGNQKLCHIF